MRTLIVDDSSFIREYLRQHLERMGVQTMQAVDGSEALEVLRRGECFDLMLVDVNMPRMSGVELVESFAQQPTTSPRPPFLMLTTEGHPALIQRAKSCGAKGWMMKPFKPELLIAAARKLTAA